MDPFFPPLSFLSPPPHSRPRSSHTPPFSYPFSLSLPFPFSSPRLKEEIRLSSSAIPPFVPFPPLFFPIRDQEAKQEDAGSVFIFPPPSRRTPPKASLLFYSWEKEEKMALPFFFFPFFARSRAVRVPCLRDRSPFSSFVKEWCFKRYFPPPPFPSFFRFKELFHCVFGPVTFFLRPMPTLK